MLKQQPVEQNIFKELSLATLLIPTLVLLSALVLAFVIGKADTLYEVGAISMLLVVVALILRQNELLVLLIVMIKVYVDSYLGYAFGAQILTLILLGVFFLMRSSSFPWVNPPSLWLWFLLLASAILPSLRGVSASDSAYYYFNVIFFPLIIFWLGMVSARNTSSIHRLFQLLAAFATLIAVITIIQSVDGVLLFKSTRYDSALALLSNYQLGTTGIARPGAYFINPDSDGGFLGVMLLIPFGLLAVSRSLLGKVIYCLEIVLLLLALLSTYATSAWIGVVAGIVTLLVFVGHKHYRLLFFGLIFAAALVLFVFFPTQVNLQLQHALLPSEASLRLAAWQTGIQVIRAFPFTGLGMGRYVYFERADPYRVFEQHVPLDHPHNSFLELAALGGIQVSIIFTLLILLALWRSLKNWTQSPPRNRTLIATGMATVVALTAYSMSNAGWTFVPLATMGWLILGLISSPLWNELKDARRVVETE